MRLDLFLKLSRLVKRRAVARELCDRDRVLVNGQIAKASKEIKPGDLVRLLYSTRTIELKVLALPVAGRKNATEDCYIVAENQRTDTSDHS